MVMVKMVKMNHWSTWSDSHLSNPFPLICVVPRNTTVAEFNGSIHNLCVHPSGYIRCQYGFVSISLFLSVYKHIIIYRIYRHTWYRLHAYRHPTQTSVFHIDRESPRLPVWIAVWGERVRFGRWWPTMRSWSRTLSGGGDVWKPGARFYYPKNITY